MTKLEDFQLLPIYRELVKKYGPTTMAHARTIHLSLLDVMTTAEVVDVANCIIEVDAMIKTVLSSSHDTSSSSSN